MDSNSLYYFFSTNAQVLAAISALLAIFTQFKLSELNAFLIGDGIATFERMSSDDIGYKFSDPYTHKKYLNRLRDSIGRKSISGIHEVLNMLASQEAAEGKNEMTNPRGLIFLRNKFAERSYFIQYIKDYTKRSIVISFITILISLISLACVHYIKSNEIFSVSLVALSLVGTLISMTFTTLGVYKGLETDDDF